MTPITRFIATLLAGMVLGVTLCVFSSLSWAATARWRFERRYPAAYLDGVG